jgi:hypothetical protein
MTSESRALRRPRCPWLHLPLPGSMLAINPSMEGHHDLHAAFTSYLTELS